MICTCSQIWLAAGLSMCVLGRLLFRPVWLGFRFALAINQVPFFGHSINFVNRAVLVPVFGVPKTKQTTAHCPRGLESLTHGTHFGIGSDGRLKLRCPSRASMVCIFHSSFLGTGVSQWKKEGTM